MNKFLTLTEAQRRTVFEQTATKIKLPVAAIEKDFWVFTSIRDVDYTPDIRKRITLTPPESVIEEWKNDYATMVMNMIYEDNVSSFADILGAVAKIENMFKA